MRNGCGQRTCSGDYKNSPRFILQTIAMMHVIAILVALHMCQSSHSINDLGTDSFSDDYLKLPGYQVPGFSKELSGKINNCPLSCTCKHTLEVDLSIQCIWISGDDLSKILHSHLDTVSLEIKYSSLSKFPLEICLMSELLSLDLSGNDIPEVPWGCLKNLSKLYTLDLSYNALTKVKNGSLYDFGSNFWSINLNDNKIRLIEHDVFRQSNRLGDLRTINLSGNNFTSIDSWPLNLATNAGDVPMDISVIGNGISQMTSQGREQTYSSNGSNSVIYFQDNLITHFMDVFNGWGVMSSDIGTCLEVVDFALGRNPLICDCTDFEVYKFLHGKVWNNNYDDLVCAQPSHLKGWNPLKVSLSSFVCPLIDDCPDGCTCFNTPYSRNITLICGAFSEKDLPEHVPELPDQNYHYYLNFGNNNLRNVSFRSYLKQVAELIVSNNIITEISVEALNALHNVKLLYLDNNTLNRMPEDITSIQFKSLAKLRLGNNPWDCSCGSAYIKDWINVFANRIQDTNKIICESPNEMAGSKMAALDEGDFCPKSRSNTYVIIAVTVTVAVIIICLPLLIAFKNRVWIYKKTNWHPINKDECVGEGKEFDIFVSYDNEDEEYVGEYLIPELEMRGFKICFHRVHFSGGKPITESIYDCIARSKRTLAFFSHHFKESDWCMWEFSVAHELDLKYSHRRLVIIKDTDIVIEELEITPRTYFNTCSFVIRESPRFWDNLLYVLPVNRMGIVANPEMENAYGNYAV